MNLGKNGKAIIAGIGTTVTAVSTFLATLSLAVGDDAISLEEVSSLVTAAVALGVTVYGVWRHDNNQVVSTNEPGWDRN